MEINRLNQGPIITPELDESVSSNINGPSMIKCPSWVDNPLGEYYLYFADHRGDAIRLAYADDISGPWSIYSPGTLTIDEAGAGFNDHIASPDVHIDEKKQRIRMYYHGAFHPYYESFPDPLPNRIFQGLLTTLKAKFLGHSDPRRTNQFTRIALSQDGLDFSVRREPLGRFYFRVFKYNETFYALAKYNKGNGQASSGQRLYRSKDGISQFQPGPVLFNDGARHTAIYREKNKLHVFYSRIGDAPERILHSTIDLSQDWKNWSSTEPQTILSPEYKWEGADQPIKPSQAGAADELVHELRDPAIFEDQGQYYLLYSVAGEQGIAIANISMEET